jgi:ABC-2 type transport system ATP-binding protein
MNAIEVKNLTKQFEKDLLVLDSVSFKVKADTCFALIGPNGAGKSTLIKILTTLLKPTSGEAFVFGSPLKERKNIREKIGLVSENTVFYDQLSAMENLLFFAGLYHIPRKIAKHKAENLLKSVDMWKWRDKPIKEFSTGMRQRINLVRGLMHSPQLLFLDEPTLALDPQTSLTIRETIKNVKKNGVTVFFTTHLMKNVEELADEIAVINKGKIIAQGKLEELKTQFNSGKKRVKIVFEDETSAQKGYDFLKEFEKNDVELDDNSVLLYLESSDSLREALSLITKNGLLIKDVNTHSASLEEIFIKMTSSKQ